MAQKYQKFVNLPNMAATKKEKNDILSSVKEMSSCKFLIYNSILQFYNFDTIFYSYTYPYVYVCIYYVKYIYIIVYNRLYNLLNISHSTFSRHFSTFCKIVERPP